jgi:hypothetical protein
MSVGEISPKCPVCRCKTRDTLGRPITTRNCHGCGNVTFGVTESTIDEATEGAGNDMSDTAWFTREIRRLAIERDAAERRATVAERLVALERAANAEAETQLHREENNSAEHSAELVETREQLRTLARALLESRRPANPNEGAKWVEARDLARRVVSEAEESGG